MNENSGGTPNPLNPTPLQPVEPETPETPEMMAGPESTGAPEMPVAETPAGETVAVETPTTAQMPVMQSGPVAEEPLTPVAVHTTARAPRPATGRVMDVRPAGNAGRPMQPDAARHHMNVVIENTPAGVSPRMRTDEPMPVPKDSIVEGGGKKKHGWLIALIIVLLLAIGGAVAAILILKPFDQPKADPVSQAIEKLLTEEKPQKLSLKGTATITPKNSDSYTSLKIDFDSGIDLKNEANFANATITMAMVAGGELEFEVEEIYTSDGDLYLRMSGLADTLTGYANSMAGAAGTVPTNCIDDESGMTNCGEIYDASAMITEMFSGVLEMIDNEWIRLDVGSADGFTDFLDMDADTLCLASAAKHLGELGGAYKTNPFVTSELAEGKGAGMYKLGIDEGKYNAFEEEFHNSAFMNSYRSCAQTKSSSEWDAVPATQQAYFITDIKDVYVKLDGNNNITRLMFATESDTAPMSVDVTIGYPTTVTIDEPEYYTDLEQLFMDMFMPSYTEGL